MAGRDTFGQVLASGTQDLAALAGLFCTDSVEANLLSTHFGYGTAAISSFSMLGILGLVRATTKISLGLEGCRAAGFNLDSIRGMFGYKATETPVGGSSVACETADIIVTDTELTVTKQATIFDDAKNPMVQVGSDWPEGLANKTVVNLGNKKAEESVMQSWFAASAFAFMSCGTTAWLITCVSGPWNWTRIFATVVFHICLLFNVGVPIWFQYRTCRPGIYLNTRLWNILTSRSIEQCHFQVLQAHVRDGNVLHFQGTTKILQSFLGRGATLVLAVLTAICYVCQYAIVKEGTNTQSIIWVASQGAGALLRVVWWIVDPSFDDPNSNMAEYALLNNTAFSGVTLFELISSCGCGETLIATWAWKYLRSTHPVEILQKAIARGKDDVIPEDAEICLASNLDLTSLLQGRQQHSLEKCGAEWSLALWRHKDGAETFPILLVKVIVVKHSAEDVLHGVVCQAWVESVRGRCLNQPELFNPNTMFVTTFDSKRFTLQPYDYFLGQPSNGNDVYVASDDTWKALSHRSWQVEKYVESLFQRQDLLFRHVNTWGKPAWTSARGGSIDRRGSQVDHSGLRILDVPDDLGDGLEKIGTYVAEKYRTSAQEKTKITKPISTTDHLV